MVLLRDTPKYGYLYPKEAGYQWDNSGVLRSNILLAGNEIIRFIYDTDLRKIGSNTGETHIIIAGTR